jgi:hypothetical protein
VSVGACGVLIGSPIYNDQIGGITKLEISYQTSGGFRCQPVIRISKTQLQSPNLRSSTPCPNGAYGWRAWSLHGLLAFLHGSLSLVYTFRAAVNSKWALWFTFKACDLKALYMWAPLASSPNGPKRWPDDIPSLPAGRPKIASVSLTRPR